MTRKYDFGWLSIGDEFFACGRKWRKVDHLRAVALDGTQDQAVFSTVTVMPIPRITVN